MILPKLFPKINTYCYAPFTQFSSVAAKPYYPIKKLDFSKSDFQCIYRNLKLPLQAKIIGRSMTLGFLPSGIYLAYYLAFLDLNNLWNLSIFGFTIGFGIYHALMRLNVEGIFVYELYIDKSGKKFQASLTKNVLKIKESELIKVEFEEENIRERQMVDLGLEKKEGDTKDLVILMVNKKSKDLRAFDVKLYLKENSLEDCNEYLSAIGEGSQIIMRK